MNKFKLYNVKSFKESEEIEIKPLTFFVGRNSCGKSSLIRFPVLLAQTFQEDVVAPLLLFGHMLDYGNYDDVVNKHSCASFGFSLEFGPEIKSRISRAYVTYSLKDFTEIQSIIEYFEKIENVTMDIRIAKPDKKMVVQEVGLEVNKKEVFRLRLLDKYYDVCVRDGFGNLNLGDKEEHIHAEFSMVHFNRFIPRIYENELTKRYVENLPNMEKKEKENVKEILDANYEGRRKKTGRKFSNDTWTFMLAKLLIIDTLFSGISDYLNRYARQISYVGPFRENPKRTYRDSESNYDDVGVRGENAGMLLRQASQDNSELIKEVSEWFNQAMGYTVGIKDIGSSLYSLVVQRILDDGMEESDNIMDVGYGISQVLPIVTQLLKNNVTNDQRYIGRTLQKNTFIIEQPELHLHPAAQAELANLFVKSVNFSKSRRILVETHSEHLIRKIQVLIADPDVPIESDQIAFYYVEKDEKGNSYVKKMEINKNGQFEEAWPSGFFDKSYDLASELLFANGKKKK